MQDDVNRLLSVISIESFISKYVTLKRRGINYIGLCPFHGEKTPSFTVSPEKGIFKCFGCGKGGNVVTFVQEYDKVPFIKALELLSEYSGVKLKPLYKKHNRIESQKKDIKQEYYSVNQWVHNIFIKVLNKTPSAIEYIKKRGFNEETIKEFTLGYAPNIFRFLELKSEELYKNDIHKLKKLLKSLETLGLVVPKQESSYNRFQNRVIFPILNLDNQIIGFGGRIIDTEKQNIAKYINSPESIIYRKKESLYNLNKAKGYIRSEGQAILVEGYLDVMSLWQQGIHNVIAPLGTSLTKEQCRLLKRYTDTTILFFDSDNAGIQSAYKALLLLSQENIYVKTVVLNENMDPCDYAMSNDTLDLITLLDDAKSELKFLLWYFFSFLYDISDLNQKKNALHQFFRLITSKKEVWEQIEYLKKAAPLLDISEEILIKDFKAFSKQPKNKVILNTPIGNKETLDVTPTSKNPVEKLEQEIIAFLLYWPYLWEDEVLLKEIQFDLEDYFLLYTFFRDRLKIGKLWEWNEMKHVLSILPSSLSNILSGILMKYDITLKEYVHVDVKDIQKKFKKLILHKKIFNIDLEIKKYQKELIKENILDSESLDEITLTVQHLIQNKATLLAKIHQ